jgi:hypothetical protein
MPKVREEPKQNFEKLVEGVPKAREVFKNNLEKRLYGLIHIVRLAKTKESLDIAKQKAAQVFQEAQHLFGTVEQAIVQDDKAKNTELTVDNEGMDVWNQIEEFSKDFTARLEEVYKNLGLAPDLNLPKLEDIAPSFPKEALQPKAETEQVKKPQEPVHPESAGATFAGPEKEKTDEKPQEQQANALVQAETERIAAITPKPRKGNGQSNSEELIAAGLAPDVSEATSIVSTQSKDPPLAKPNGGSAVTRAPTTMETALRKALGDKAQKSSEQNPVGVSSVPVSAKAPVVVARPEEPESKIPPPVSAPQEKLALGQQREPKNKPEFKVVAGQGNGPNEGKEALSVIPKILRRKTKEKEPVQASAQKPDRNPKQPAKTEQAAEALRRSPAYKFLERKSLLGMTLSDARALLNEQNPPAYVPEAINRDNLRKALSQFEADIAAGYDPLGRIAGEITIELVDDLRKLNAGSLEESETRFKEVVRETWRDFVFERKASGRTDSDAKVSMWLLGKAGIRGARTAAGVRHRDQRERTFSIDIGGESGIVAKKTLEGKLSVIIDNHARAREFETSSAKIVYELLKHAEFFTELGAEKKRGIEHMIQYTVDEDNSSFPITKAGRVADFENSYQTVRGLGRQMSAEQLYEYFRINGQGGKSYEAYERALYRNLTPQEVTAYGLDKPEQGQTYSPQEKIKYRVGKAKEILTRPLAELVAEGKAIYTKNLGTYFVDLIGREKQSVNHEAVQAYGEGRLSGYLIYTAEGFFMINTLKRDVDLSKIPELRALEKKFHQGVFVRGAIFINDDPARKDGIKLRDILTAITDERGFRPKGKIEEVLELEAEGKFTMEINQEFSGERKILEQIAKDYLASFKEWLLRAYELDEDMLRRGVGDRFYMLISGNVDGYIQSLENEGDKKIKKGNEVVRREIISNNVVPHLKRMLLEKFPEEKLKEVLGQAYYTLGLRRKLPAQKGKS